MQPFALRRLGINPLHSSPLQMSESKVSFFVIFGSIGRDPILAKIRFRLLRSRPSYGVNLVFEDHFC